MRITSFVITIFLMIGLDTSAQIGAKVQGKMEGTWVNNDFGYQMTLILNAGGDGEFDGEGIRYTVQGNNLTVVQQGESTTYNFELSGNVLKVSGGDLEQVIAFGRQGTPGNTTSAPNTSIQSNLPAIQNAIPKNLIGVWSGYNEAIEFKSNGECIYRGQPFTYSVAGNQISLYTSQGTLPVEYAVAGNQLNLKLNGQTLTYSKAGTASSTAAPVKTGTKGIDQTLVGKWCYVNVYSSNSGGSSAQECITLKGDGTYQYYSESSRSVNTSTVAGGTSSQDSDQGTWWVQGDRIFYNSQTQGQGSYRLEKRNHPKNNDPMIVLEGKTFVTSTVKNPW